MTFLFVFVCFRRTCQGAWSQLRLSPVFGCICPSSLASDSCEQIFKTVNGNPCIGKTIHSYNGFFHKTKRKIFFVCFVSLSSVFVSLFSLLCVSALFWLFPHFFVCFLFHANRDRISVPIAWTHSKENKAQQQKAKGANLSKIIQLVTTKRFRWHYNVGDLKFSYKMVYL